MTSQSIHLLEHVDSTESDTLILNRLGRPAFRVLRTSHTESLEPGGAARMSGIEEQLDLYFGGNVERGFPFGGQVAGRITSVKSVADILGEAVRGCHAALREALVRAGCE